MQPVLVTRCRAGHRSVKLDAILCVALVLTAPAAQAQADAQKGAQAYKTCIACHSLEPGRHLTGPSLANLFGRKAGTASSFLRYSDALRRSGVVWDERTLDAWLKEPDKFVPGNDMAFPGIKDDKTRRDIIGYLRAVDATPGTPRPAGPRMANLKKAKPDSIVKSVRHCGDTFFVGTEDGNLYKIWEFNLRLKTDTSDHGPAPGKPVILGVGMRGDRTAVVFSSLTELGAFVKEQCG
jgi:cytochrome c